MPVELYLPRSEAKDVKCNPAFKLCDSYGRCIEFNVVKAAALSFLESNAPASCVPELYENGLMSCDCLDKLVESIRHLRKNYLNSIYAYADYDRSGRLAEYFMEDPIDDYVMASAHSLASDFASKFTDSFVMWRLCQLALKRLAPDEYVRNGAKKAAVLSA